MTDTQSLKVETTKSLHSLLISGGALSVRQLEQDYKCFIGAHIPYQEMGYANLENYLRDCPQKFNVYWEGPIKMIRHVTNDETLHIERMINNQKKKPGAKRRAKTVRITRQVYSSSQRYPKPQNQPEPSRLAPVVHNTLRGKIKGLLYDYRTGLLGSNFDAAYSKRFGGQVAFREQGFDSLLSLFQSMSDIVRIEQLPSGIYKLYPKSGGAMSRPNITSTADSGPKNLPPRLQKRAGTDQHRRRRSASAEKDPPPVAPSHRGSAPCCSRSTSKQTSVAPPPAGPIVLDEDLWDDDPYDTSGVNLTLQKEIMQVLAKFPDGVWAAEFPAEYRVMFRREMDRRSQGYDSVISLMSALPHIVTIHRPNQKDWKLYDARIKQEPLDVRRRKESEKSSSSSRQERSHSSFTTAPPVSEDLRETIRQVIAHYPAGLLLGELPDMFLDLTGRVFDPADLGYATLESFITSTALTDLVRLHYRQGTGQILLFARSTENPPRTDKLVKLKTISPPPAPKPLYQRREIPADAVGPGASYRPQDIPHSVLNQEMKYIEVYVSTVTNPGNMWVQLKSDNTEELEVLMDDLEYFYKNKQRAEEYTLPSELIAVGQVCAAIYPNDNDWHRCTITGFVDMDFVQVYYVDYGSINLVTKKSLKFLKMSFMKLPAQAIRAKLANISPLEADWAKGAKERLLQLVSNRPLVALITDISQDNLLSLCLTDTSTANDVHINDLLVFENLARMELHELPPETLEECQDYPPEGKLPSSGSGSGYGAERHEDIQEEGERHIKYVELTSDHHLHILRWNNIPYVTSFEISKLLWDRDVLRSMMRKKKLSLPKLVISREEHGHMFDQLIIHEVGGVEDTEGNAKTHVTIFELTSLAEILNIFNHPDERLKAAVQHQITSFSPEDTYWRGEMDSDGLDDDLESEDDEDDYKYGRQTLETALQSLQFRRKKILQAMQAMNATNSTCLVEDLQNVEHQLGDIKKRIRELEKLEKADGSDRSGGSQKMTEEDALVCAVVSEQHDSYIERNTSPPNPDPVSPSVRILPLQPSTPRSGVKTNPVAPMPAEPRASQATSIPGTTALPNMMMGMSLGGAAAPDATNPMMMMPFGVPTGDTDFLKQQMMLYNMVTMQSVLQHQAATSAGTPQPMVDPAMFTTTYLQQQQLLAAQMQGYMGYSLGSSTFGRGSGIGRGCTATNPQSQGLGSSLGLGVPYGMSGVPPNTSTVGRGRGSMVEHPPGGLSKKE